VGVAAVVCIKTVSKNSGCGRLGADAILLLIVPVFNCLRDKTPVYSLSLFSLSLPPLARSLSLSLSPLSLSLSPLSLSLSLSLFSLSSFSLSLSL
jgi:hypothetical protein